MSDPTKITVPIRDGNNSLRDMIFEDAAYEGGSGLIPYHKITGSVEVTSSTDNPVFAHITNTDALTVGGTVTVQADSAHPVYVTASYDHPISVSVSSSAEYPVYANVTSSDTNPVYVTASFNHPVSVKVSSSAEYPVYTTISSSAEFPVSVTSIDTQVTSVRNTLYTSVLPDSTNVKNLTLNTVPGSSPVKQYYKFTVPADPNRKIVTIFNNNDDLSGDAPIYISINEENFTQIDENGPLTYSLIMGFGNLYTSEPGTGNLSYSVYIQKTTSLGAAQINVTEYLK